MGVSTNLNVIFFSKEKEKIQKVEHDGRADDFIYHLLNDGGSTFDPDKLGSFSDEEKEILKIYFDANSMSVMEGYATVTPNIQDPNKLKKIWRRIRSKIIKEFDDSMKDYHEHLSHDSSIKMSEYSFEKKVFNYTWSLDSISGILSLLELAIASEYLVEITVSDF